MLFQKQVGKSGWWKIYNNHQELKLVNLFGNKKVYGGENVNMSSKCYFNKLIRLND